jgi:hypothetical protein
MKIIREWEDIAKKPSNELISEILNITVQKIDFREWIGLVSDDAFDPCICIHHDGILLLNIHELAAKAEAWVIESGYNIDPSVWLSDEMDLKEENIPLKTVLFDIRVEGYEKSIHGEKWCCLYEWDHNKLFKYKPLVVLEACEWIYKHKKEMDEKYNTIKN